MNPLRKTLSTCLLALAGWAVLTGSSTDVFHWDLPAWVPRPVVPADNPMSAAKVELGRHLFYDQRLSAGRAGGTTNGPSPLRSSLIGGFEVSEQEVSDLVAFLNTLTDHTFVHNPRHANPWTVSR